MPELVVGYTDLDGGKLKIGNGFLEPNFGVGPNWVLENGRDIAIFPAVGYSPIDANYAQEDIAGEKLSARDKTT